jgi:hypothetical protein
MTDYRALCAELVHELENTQKSLMYHQGCSAILDSIRCAVVDHARAALAKPEPVGPTDEQVAKIIFGESYYAFGFDSYPPPWEHLEDCLIRQCCVDAARAVLARWGTPAKNTREDQ